ncbi:Phage minor tail protein [Leptolyngbya sp. PCC 7375]|nr:Phage minor tail protein [Leptolyngbya sp. PCC 7375]
MANLPTLTLSPSWDISESTRIPYSESELGDGYVSRVNKTISIARQWNIRRVGLTTVEKDSLVTELSLYTGVDAFLWSPHPLLPKSAYFCDDWSVSPLGPDAWEITALFKEDVTGEESSFAELLDDVAIDSMLAGSLQWLQTYTRDTLPLAANSDYVTVNAFHNVLGRGGYFPGSAGTTEGQAALGRACMEAFFVSGDVAWKNYAIALGNALIEYYYNDPVPAPGSEFNTIWLSHWLINVKESFVSRGPANTVDPLNYGDFGRTISFTNGVGVIPNGNPSDGELLAVVYKVYSVDGILLWQNVDAPLVAGTEYQIEYFVSDFQLKGQNYRIFPDTEASGGTPPVATAETAGLIKLTSNYTGSAKLVYSTYSGPVIQVNQTFEAWPVWRRLL